MGVLGPAATIAVLLLAANLFPMLAGRRHRRRQQALERDREIAARYGLTE